MNEKVLTKLYIRYIICDTSELKNVFRNFIEEGTYELRKSF